MSRLRLIFTGTHFLEFWLFIKAHDWLDLNSDAPHDTSEEEGLWISAVCPWESIFEGLLYLSQTS